MAKSLKYVKKTTLWDKKSFMTKVEIITKNDKYDKVKMIKKLIWYYDSQNDDMESKLLVKILKKLWGKKP